MKIRTRLIIQFTLLVSGLFLLAFAGIYWFRSWDLEQAFYKRLRQKAITTAELYLKVDEVDTELLKVIDQSNRDVLPKENVTIYDFKNDPIYQSNDSIKFNISDNLLKVIRLQKEVKFTQGQFKVIGLVYVDLYDRVVSVAGAVDTNGEQELKNLRQILIWGYVVVVGFAGLMGRFFAQRALKPISDVMDELDATMPQDLSNRLKIQNEEDEIGRLAAKFNELLERIEQAFKRQNTFISNVSHELKNPLTKMVAQLEVSLLKERSVGEYQDTMRSVLDDIRNLNQLSNALLELAKVSDKEGDFLYTKVRIDETLWEARELLVQTPKSYRVLVNFPDQLDDEELLEINGNPHLLRTAFVNLMENGCKFSANKTVSVTMRCLKNEIQLDFLNEGPTIPPNDLALIFQPFYRADNTAGEKGYGVGLSLVQRIVKLHNAKISVVSTQGQTVFSVHFPYALGKF